MTVSSSSAQGGPYEGNGATVTFSFTFQVQSEEDVRVVFTTGSSDVLVDTDLVYNTDYTVSINADQETSPGGSITCTIAPLADQYITILRNVEATQGADLQNQGGFYPQVIENALDKLTMLLQQFRVDLSRALTLSYADTTSKMSLETFLTTIRDNAEAVDNSAAAAAASESAAATSESSAAAAASAAVNIQAEMSSDAAAFLAGFQAAIDSVLLTLGTLGVPLTTLAAASASYTYNGDGTLASSTESVAGKTRTASYTYNGDGTLNTAAVTYDGHTRTETYTYSSGVLTGMSAVET